jgi:transcription termination/antitermination protein NusG
MTEEEKALLPPLPDELKVKKAVEEVVEDDKRWFSLRVISGKENKIKERIERQISQSGWENIVFQVIVPTERVYKVRNGKKVPQERNLLPGYILVEAYGSKLNGEVAKAISDLQNVINFLGKEAPIPMTQAEANRLLGKVDQSAESGEIMLEPFLVGETIKIIDGPFANFVGDIQEVNEERKKLKVIVKIFGRGTEVELNFIQVEKIS